MLSSGLKSEQVVSLTEAKAQLHNLIKRISRRDEAVVFTHDGVPTAVLLAFNLYEGFIETADILSDRKTTRSLRQSLRQAGKGKWVSHRAAFRSSTKPVKNPT